MALETRGGQSEECEVLVIGAGIAGLSAARVLHENKVHTIVLEAQDRIGGRVKSAKLTRNLKKNRETENEAASDGNGKEGKQTAEFDGIGQDEEETLGACTGKEVDKKEHSRVHGRSGGGMYKVAVDDDCPEDYDDGGKEDNEDDVAVNNAADDEEFDEQEPYIFVELGPNWIHGLSEDLNPLLSISKLLGLRLQPTSSDDEPGDDVKLYSSSGVVCRDDDYLLAQQRYEWIRDNLQHHAHGFNTVKGLMEHYLSISTRVESLGKINNAQRKIFQWF